MKVKGLAPFAFATALVFASPAGQGQLIDQGGTTLDPLTNLLWLDTSSTVNVSAQAILNGTDPGNLLAAGWSFASVSQIDTLLTNAGLIGPFNGGLSSQNFAAASSFVSLLGATGTGFIQAFSSNQPSPGFLNSPAVLAIDFGGGSGAGGADLPGPPLPITVVNSTIGSWLVMSNPVGPPVAAVPEPEIYAMMGVGLALLGWVGRKKKRQAAA